MRIPAFLFGVLALAGALSAQTEPADAAATVGNRPTPIDFAKVDRTIAKLPQLSRHAIYGLYLFGQNGETRVWAVLDRSADSEHHDVLWLDRDGDGDLTDADERIVGKVQSDRAHSAAPNVVFTIGDFRPPCSDITHREFTITWTAKLGVRFRMLWRGEKVTFGGYGPTIDTYAEFASSPAAAPIFVPGHDRPFEFERWIAEPLARGSDNDVRIFVGQRGDRTGAFSAVDDEFLPEGEYLVATLRYSTESGEQRHERFELRQRC